MEKHKHSGLAFQEIRKMNKMLEQHQDMQRAVGFKIWTFHDSIPVKASLKLHTIKRVTVVVLATAATLATEACQAALAEGWRRSRRAGNEEQGGNTKKHSNNRG